MPHNDPWSYLYREPAPSFSGVDPWSFMRRGPAPQLPPGDYMTPLSSQSYGGGLPYGPLASLADIFGASSPMAGPYAAAGALLLNQANKWGPGYPEGSLGKRFNEMPVPLQALGAGGLSPLMADLDPNSQAALMGSLVPFMARAPQEVQMPGLGLATLAAGK